MCEQGMPVRVETAESLSTLLWVMACEMWAGGRVSRYHQDRFVQMFKELRDLDWDIYERTKHNVLEELMGNRKVQHLIYLI